MAVDAVLVGARGTSASNTVSTTAGSVTTGDALVAIVSYDPGVTISSISDTAGNTYTLRQANTGGFAHMSVYSVDNATGHANNVLTVNFSGTAFPVAHLIKVTDAATACYDSGSLASGSPTTIPWTLTSGTLAQADSVVITCTEANRNGGTGAYAIGGSWTLLSEEPDVNNFWTSAVAKLVVASTSAVTPSWSKTGEGTSGVSRSIIVAAFRENLGGGAPVPYVEPPKSLRRAVTDRLRQLVAPLLHVGAAAPPAGSAFNIPPSASLMRRGTDRFRQMVAPILHVGAASQPTQSFSPPAPMIQFSRRHR